MDEKVKNLQNDLDTLNPRHKINQAILPRIERTRELYSQEPEVFTRSGRRVLKKPNLGPRNSAISLRMGSEDRSATGTGGGRGSERPSEAFLSESQRRLRNILTDSAYKPTSTAAPKQLKPIIHTSSSSSSAAANTDDAARSFAKMKLSGSGAANGDGAEGTTAAERKAVYFNDNVEYRSPTSLEDELKD